MPSPRIWQGPPGAIARSIGLDPDAPPEGEKTLEQLINAGASLDEPVGGGQNQGGGGGGGTTVTQVRLAR